MAAVAGAVIALLVAGCGPSTPDYKSIWTTTTSTTTTAPDTDKPISLSTYFENIGITGAPVAPDKLTDLTVTVPEPPGWKPYFNVNLSPGTRTIAKGDTIIKYGVDIGKAVADIGAGEHLHVHNVKTKRW